MHIYDFVTDEFQYRLKSQATASMPFEKTLSTYQDLFFAEFDKINVDEDTQLLHDALKQDADAVKWLAGLHDLIRKDRHNLVNLFSDIREVYNIFLRGNHLSAVTYLHNLLEKYDLLDESYSYTLGGFLRGRTYTERSRVMDKSYYNHISFHQRHLINNERFSFSGQPLLYAGQSLMAVFFELDAKSLDDEHIAVCLLSFNHFAKLHRGFEGENVKPRSRIYDISNAILETVNDTFFRFQELSRPIPAIGNGFHPNKVRRDFRKMILSHCCTFPKRRFTRRDETTGNEIDVRMNFKEEYALPQLLTEAIRLHKYNGIIYPSTKFIDKKITIKGDWQSNLFKTNLAMFTEYKQVNENIPTIDFDLYEVLQTEVIDFKNLDNEGVPVKHLSQVNIKKLIEDLLTAMEHKRNFSLKHIPYNESIELILDAFYHIEKKVLLYQRIEVDGTPYLDTKAGKMELIYLSRYFYFIESQRKMIFKDAIQAGEEKEEAAAAAGQAPA